MIRYRVQSRPHTLDIRHNPKHRLKHVFMWKIIHEIAYTVQ